MNKLPTIQKCRIISGTMEHGGSCAEIATVILTNLRRNTIEYKGSNEPMCPTSTHPSHNPDLKPTLSPVPSSCRNQQSPCYQRHGSTLELQTFPWKLVHPIGTGWLCFLMFPSRRQFTSHTLYIMRRSITRPWWVQILRQSLQYP